MHYCYATLPVQGVLHVFTPRQSDCNFMRNTQQMHQVTAPKMGFTSD